MAADAAGPGAPGGSVVTVLPDVTGVDRLFDYEVPEALAGRLVVGTIVRVPLQGRRVRGWVVATGAASTAGLVLRPVAEVVSLGPSLEVVELARFGAWRYAGRLRPFLVAASPPRTVRALPAAAARRPPGLGGGAPPRPTSPPAVVAAVRDALGWGRAVLRLPPAAPRLDVVEAVIAELALRRHQDARPGPLHGDLLVLVPERRDAETLARRLRRLGHPVACYPEAWAEAAAGGRVVVGSRAAALATVSALAGVLVLDAHADSYVEQRVPTWNATVLAAERAARAGAPCVLVSPCPTVEQLAGAGLVELPRAAERAGWPPVEVVDRRDEDPRSGLYSPRLAPLLAAAVEARPELPAVCVLNRTGRARMLACGACGEVVRCERCGAALLQRHRPDAGEATRLDCPRCPVTQPGLCTHCGSTRLKLLRVGVGRAVEELAALTGKAVAEVSGPAPAGDAPVADAPVLVGTEAVLHRVRAASVVVFLDFDQELLAPRFRAGEQALALLARAARLVGAARAPGGERAPGRVVVQTRLPGHEAILAALHADPGILAAAEAARRVALGLPPERALAEVSGDGADELAGALRSLRPAGAPAGAGGLGAPAGALEVAALGDGRYLVRGPDPATLARAFQATGLLGSGPRVEVDPLRA